MRFEKDSVPGIHKYVHTCNFQLMACYRKAGGFSVKKLYWTEIFHVSRDRNRKTSILQRRAQILSLATINECNWLLVVTRTCKKIGMGQTCWRLCDGSGRSVDVTGFHKTEEHRSWNRIKTKYLIFIILLYVCNSSRCYILSTDEKVRSPCARRVSICRAEGIAPLILNSGTKWG